MENREFVVAKVNADTSESELALSTQVSDIEFQAEALVIQNDEDYASAGEFGVMLKRKTAEVTAFFKPMKDSAHQAHKAICDREKSMLAPLKNAEAIVKKAMSAYHQEQERKRKAAEEEARRAAEEEANRILAEAQKAEASGKNEEAAALFEEACIAETSRPTVISSNAKVAGVGTRKDWEIVFIDDNAVPIFAHGVELRPVDRGAVIKLIRASKGNIRIPGVEFREVSQMMFRR